MNYNFKIINPINYPDWDNILLTVPGHTIFHSSHWARVLHDSYGYEPKYFTIVKNGNIELLIPIMEVNSIVTGKRGVGLPFSDYCEPIIAENINVKEIINEFVSCVKPYGWEYIEIRGGGRLLNEEFSKYSYFHVHKIDLSINEYVLYDNLRGSTKRNIKKAYRENIVININNSLEYLKEFYRLNCITRKYHGLPPQPYKFFLNVYKNILCKDLGYIVLASYGNKKIAGAIFFHFGTEAIYKYGASDKIYQEKRANNLIIWETIKFYCKNGYKSFCFGKTEPENSGLKQFKSGWGANQENITYYRKYFRIDLNGRNTFSVKGFYNSIFKKTPILLLRFIGSMVYKHLG